MLFGGFLKPLFLSPRADLVGIDISDFSVEILSISLDRHVTAHEREILPEGIVVDGEIKDPTKLAEIIKGILQKNKAWRESKVSASVVFPKIKTFISHFEHDIRGLDQKDISEAVRSEVLKFFPDSIDKVVWDYAFVGGKERFFKHRILYAVADSKVVEGYVETMKQVGITEFSLEIEAIAIKRALTPQRPVDASCLVVDIGANSTSLYLFKSDGDIQHTSNIKVGGKAITEEISKKKKIDIKAAENLKREKGLSDASLKKIIVGVMSPIEDEITLFIEKHEKVGGERFSKVILVGGGALMPFLDDHIATFSKREVVIGNPFEGVKKSGESFTEDAPAVLFAAVIGAGLKDVHNEPFKKIIDFAPEEYRKKSGGNRNFVITATIITILLVGALWLLLRPAPVLEIIPPPPVEEEPVPPMEEPVVEEPVPPPSEPALPPPTTLEILGTPTGWLRVRSLPSTEGSEIGRVNPGETYVYEDEVQGWYRIILSNGGRGWVYGEYIKKL